MHSPQDGGLRSGSGFSIVELIVTLAIAGILLASAAPSFTNLAHDHRIRTQINLLMADVQLARIEAIKRGADVVICRSTDGRYCARTGQSRSDWSTGWIIFANPDGDKRRDPGEPLLQSRPALPGTMTLKFNQWWRVSYHEDGSAKNGSFTLCDVRGAEHARALVIFYTGRPRIADRRSDGDPLHCG